MPAVSSLALALAELIIRSAHVITMDPAQPVATAVAVRGRDIVYVGDDAGAAAFAGPKTRVIEGHGRITVLPGLIDAHAHLVGLGLSLSRLDLRGMTSAESVAAAVARRTGSAGGWVLGRGWDQNRFHPPALPEHSALDNASHGRPVWLRRIDGHAGWANAEALRRAGVTKSTPEVAGGRIIRDQQGEPTGVFIDNAMELVERVIPPPGPAELEQAILSAASYVTRLGLTGVHDMGIGHDAVAVYRKLAEAGRLPLRVYAYAADPVPQDLAQSPDSAAYHGFLDGLAARLGPPQTGPFFSLRGIKLFMDGALGSRGAALLADYADEPGNRGLLVAAPGHIEAMSRWAMAHGYQITTHAIGDRANRLVLDAYQRAGVRADRDLRFRVEHVQIITPQDQPRLAALGVIASIQPTHATSDMPWAGARLGPERLRERAYVWQDLLHAGARLCAGSDFPVEEADPRLGLHAAVTRQDTDLRPPGAFFPAQRLSPGQAIRAFTTDAAYAAFSEDRLGQIVPGRPADLTVLDGAMDILSSGPPPGDLFHRAVLLTVVGGRVVHDSSTR